MRYGFKEVWVDEAVKHNQLTKIILKKLENIPVKYTRNTKELLKRVSMLVNPVGEGKKTLLLTRNKGPAMVACPGTKNYVCCGYRILDLTSNCNLDCSYCILQAYFKNNPIIQIYTNIEPLNLDSNKFYRIGTGEFTDSLALDDLTGFSKIIIPWFFARGESASSGKGKKNAVLELKTKTNNIGNLLKIKNPENTIISWSLNPPKIIKNEERGTASLSERLEAAKTCADYGYVLGFHFDPIIRYEGWEKDYRELIDTLFTAIAPEEIIWISLGTLRFMPKLKAIIEKRFPNTDIIYEEFITGLDGKFRYFKPLRIGMYQKVLGWIRKYSRDVFIYMCMESPEVWERVFGFRQTTASLTKSLDKRATDFFGTADKPR